MKLLKINEWKKDIVGHKNKIFLSLIFLLIAIILTVLSGNYVDEVKTAKVPDLILNNIPTIDLSPIYVWGILVVILVYLSYPFIYQPRMIHYSIGVLSLFLAIRSGFLVLTHLQAPPGAIQVASKGIFQFISYKNDLFFSGHAGIPFLGFLIYKSKTIRYFLLFASIVLSITVLLMHVHYSIDVASAYFITYGVYKIGNTLFKSNPSQQP